MLLVNILSTPGAAAKRTLKDMDVLGDKVRAARAGGYGSTMIVLCRHEPERKRETSL